MTRWAVAGSEVVDTFECPAWSFGGIPVVEVARPGRYLVIPLED